MRVICAIYIFFALVGCRSSEVVLDNHNEDAMILDLLFKTKYGEAETAYFNLKSKSLLSRDLIDQYDQYFNVIARYKTISSKDLKDTYKYASCYIAGESSSWTSIASDGNPFLLSPEQVINAKEELKIRGLWYKPVDALADVEFQRAVVYYRLLYGMNVECALYPYNAMLKSSFCGLFSHDMRCSEGYEF